MAGEPAFRKYDGNGTLIYERVVRGARSIRWSPRFRIGGRAAKCGELPLVAPMVRTAAVDRSAGCGFPSSCRFRMSTTRAAKIRTVQFRGAGIVSPSSWFSETGRVLVTPGC